MIILISGITGFNEPKTQPGCIPRPCVCVCTHGCNDSRRRVYTLAIWTGRFFQYFPAALFTPFANAYRVSLRAYACYQLRPRCAPPRRGGVAKGAARGTVDDEGEKNCVDRSRRIRDRIHGTTRVHATWFARCYEIIPLLLPLPLLSSFLFPSLSPSPRSTADFPATGFCLSALLSSLEKRTRGIRSLRRSGLIGTSLISRL